MSSRLLLTSAGLLLTAGCNAAYRDIGSPDPAFGEAVKWDMAVQIINPDPVYDDLGAQPGDSGVHGAEATKRYRTDRVKDVQEVETTTGTSGGPQ